MAGRTLTLVPDDYQAELVGAIAAALQKKGWSAKDLARAMGYEYDTTVKRWLRRQKAISVASLERIASALEMTAQEIDPKGQAYDPQDRPPHMRRGRKTGGLASQDLVAQLEEAKAGARARLAPFRDAASGPDYLEAMALWWNELEPDDKERVHDFARELRDSRRELKRKAAG